MIGNIIAGLFLFGWLLFVICYIVQQKRNAKLSGSHICIGCPGAAACKSCRHKTK